MTKEELLNELISYYASPTMFTNLRRVEMDKAIIEFLKVKSIELDLLISIYNQ